MLTSPHTAPFPAHSCPCSEIRRAPGNKVIFSSHTLVPFSPVMTSTSLAVGWWVIFCVAPFSSPGSFSPGSSGAAGGQSPPQPRGESVLHQGCSPENGDPRPQTLWLTRTSALSPSSWEIVGLGPLKVSLCPSDLVLCLHI